MEKENYIIRLTSYKNGELIPCSTLHTERSAWERFDRFEPTLRYPKMQIYELDLYDLGDETDLVSDCREVGSKCLFDLDEADYANCLTNVKH